jgi:hypothetical protein
MIGERRGGSKPSNAQLYARILREQKISLMFIHQQLQMLG